MFAVILFVCVTDWCGFVSPTINLYGSEKACAIEAKRLATDVLKNAPEAKVMLSCLQVRGETI